MVGDSSANKVGEDRKTCIDGCIEALLLHRNDLKNIISLSRKLGISATAFLNRGSNGFGEECSVYSEKLTVTASAADDTAKNVAAALV